MFNLASNYRFDADHDCPICILNIAETGASSVLDGICVEMDALSLDIILQREKDFEFCQIKTHKIHNRRLDKRSAIRHFRNSGALFYIFGGRRCAISPYDSLVVQVGFLINFREHGRINRPFLSIVNGLFKMGKYTVSQCVKYIQGG